MIEIMNLRNTRPTQPYDFRIDRASVLGNPYVMSRGGDYKKWMPMPAGAGKTENKSGTGLYERQINQSDNDLMKKVWDGTPWMIDVDTGSIESDRYQEIMQWCREQFGPEAWPIHGKPGDWQCGSVTIHGRTWMGFKTEKMMELFLKVWSLPSEKDVGDMRLEMEFCHTSREG